MATFTNLEYKNIFFQDYLFFQAKGPLTEEDIQSINRITKKVILVFDNTKDMNPNLIRKIHNNNVKISVKSGLDYPHKQKIQDAFYIERTIYKPNELASIIEFYQKMEKNIRYTWTPRQKAMYVYKTLAENMHYKEDYEPEYENGKDISRSLSGLLYGRMVCAGFAMAFQEAMERLGIPCHYQIIPYVHCFNILELDHNYYGIDLTWDCFGKKRNNNQCGFSNFGICNNFYQHPDHNLDNNPEEKKYSLSTFSVEELRNDYAVIAYQNYHEKRPMIPIHDSNDTIFVSMVKYENDIYHYLVYVHEQAFFIHSKKKDDQLISMDIFDAIKNKGWDPSIPEKERSSSVVPYRRDDESVFVLTKSSKEAKDVGEYYYFDVVIRDGAPTVRRAALLSEMDLSYDWKEPVRGVIANKLLSRDRLANTLKSKRGYVGYIGVDHSLHYHRDFERDNLHL